MSFFDYIYIGIKLFKKGISKVLGLASTSSTYDIVQLDLSKVDYSMQQKLKVFEEQFTYPFDHEQRFRIQHGRGKKDYFKFFTEMGACVCYIAFNKKARTVEKVFKEKKKTFLCEKGEIAAVACAVLRKIPQKNKPAQKIWYICDFKVAEKFRGERLSMEIFTQAIWDQHIFKSTKGYGICMDSMDRSEPIMVKAWRKNGLLKAGRAKIHLYSFNYAQLHSLRDKLESILDYHPLTFKAMKGIKDFEIFSPDTPDKKSSWKLLHIQQGPLGERNLSDCIIQNPKKGYEHMIAAIAGTPLDEALQTLTLPQGSKIVPQATATLLYAGLNISFFYDKMLTNHI